LRRCRTWPIVYLTPRPAHLGDAYPPAYAQHHPPAPPDISATGSWARVKTWVRRAGLGVYGYEQFVVPHGTRRLARLAMRIPLVRWRVLMGFNLLPRGARG